MSTASRRNLPDRRTAWELEQQLRQEHPENTPNNNTYRPTGQELGTR